MGLERSKIIAMAIGINRYCPRPTKLNYNFHTKRMKEPRGTGMMPYKDEPIQLRGNSMQYIEMNERHLWEQSLAIELEGETREAPKAVMPSERPEHWPRQRQSVALDWERPQWK